MNDDEKVCPRCAETIKRAAVVCRYCGHEFGEGMLPSTQARAGPERGEPSQWLPPKSNTLDDPSGIQRNTGKQLGKVAGWGCLGILVIAFIGAITGGGQGSDTDNATAPTALDSTNAALPIDAFDNVSGSEAAAAPTSDWSVSTAQDELRGRTIYYAQATSENRADFDFPYSGGSTLTLTVRRHPKWGDDVVFEISKGQFVCGIDDCRGTINFGSGAAPITLSEPEDHSSDTLFAANASSIIAKLKKSDRVIVELPFFQEGNRQFTFQTKGLVWPPKD
jgi:hypothetical protein